MKTVRILPMSHEDPEFVGKTIEEVQRGFFEGTLKEECGVYRCLTSGLTAEDGNLVLFQMDNQIIASAIFERNIPNPNPVDGYKRHLWFYVDTIKTFNLITKDELKEYIPELKKLSEVKYVFKLTDEQYNKLIERMV